jgi:cyclohexadieny/prephenate dehydrogenase
MSQPLFAKMALIGLGLIGSARSEATRQKALELGFVDHVEADPGALVADADLVVICTPLGAYEDVARAIGPSLAPGAIVTDVGSVKQAVIRDVGPFIPEGVHFVPGHPVAGTEHSGPEAGFAALFEDRFCILTPPAGTDPQAVERITRLWQACGSKVEIMDAAHHDKVLAMTSHLPHLIAYTIVNTATDLEESYLAEVIKYSAGGFRDFTRIAASDPVMWRDVFLNNREAVLEMVQRFTEDITGLQRAIRWGEGDKLEELFRRTRDIRRGVLEQHQAGTFDAREPEKAATAAPDPDKANRPEE